MDDLDNIDDLNAEEYDACIKVAPEAKLKYLDEEDDEVIVSEIEVVGSSFWTVLTGG